MSESIEKLRRRTLRASGQHFSDKFKHEWANHGLLSIDETRDASSVLAPWAFIREHLVSPMEAVDRGRNVALFLAYSAIDPARDEVRHKLKEELESLCESASTEGWDGEGALPVSPETAQIAAKLIDDLPAAARMPDVSVTPHGEVDLDWHHEGIMLTVSVGPDGKIAYAGMFDKGRKNTSKVSGVEAWNGKLPSLVGCCLERFEEARSA